jgi:hypothetical protein
MITAAETSPVAILRFNPARASRTWLARSSARRRCGPGVIMAVCVIRFLSPCVRSAEADARGQYVYAQTCLASNAMKINPLVIRAVLEVGPCRARHSPKPLSDRHAARPTTSTT